jgi:hypothetical protein
MRPTLAIRALFVCLAAFIVLASVSLFAPAVALAQHGAGGKKSIAVGIIEGPQGEPTRKRVLQNLKKSSAYEITDAEDLRPGSDKGAYAAMAQALQVDAIIVGNVSRNLDLTLSVIGPDGNLIEDVKLKGGSAPELESAIDNELEIAIAGPLGGKKAAEKAKPSEPEPEDEEEALPGDEKDEEEDKGDQPKQKEEEEPSETQKPGRRPLELLVGGRLYSRDFAYSKPQPKNAFPYKLAIAPAIIAAVRVYPFAFFRDDALSHLGITGKLEVGIATSTNYQQPQTGTAPPITFPLNTGTSEWQVGLRGRLPLGESELGIFGVYGAHAFILVGDEGPSGTPGTPGFVNRPTPLVPDVNYQFLRFGFDARLRVKKLSVGAHFAPRFLTSLRNIDQSGYWFPGATGSGIDFGASVGYEIVSFMDVAVGADYVRYGFDFNNIPSDAGTPGSTAPVIAGGATDTFLSGWLGVIFHFDGKAKVEDGAVAVEAKPSKKPSVEEEEEE